MMRRKIKARYLLVIGAFLLHIMASAKVGAERIKIGENVGISTRLKMEIIEDGKLTDWRMLVHLFIYDNKGKIHVVWDHIVIVPQHDMKQVLLKHEHYSVEDGSIYNVIANNDNFSFTIHLNTGGTVQIVGNKVKGGFTYSIQGVALWWSDILKDKIKIEWRSTTKKFILPYKEVF